jgi:hypothetical protein
VLSTRLPDTRPVSIRPPSHTRVATATVIIRPLLPGADVSFPRVEGLCYLELYRELIVSISPPF